MSEQEYCISTGMGGSSLLRRRLQALAGQGGSCLPAGVETMRQVARLGRDPAARPFHVGTVWALIDTSSSMAGTPLIQARCGLEEFCGTAVGFGYQVGVIAFSSIAREVAGATADARRLAESIRALEAGGSTEMAEAIQMATGRLAEPYPERIIFLVTDGYPNDKEAALAAARAARTAGIDLMTLGTETADHEFLKRIATRADLARQVSSANLQIGIAQTARLLVTAGTRLVLPV